MRLLRFSLLAVLLLTAVVVVRAATLGSRQIAVEPAPPIEVDAAGVARRLGLAIREQTVSHQVKERTDREAFARLNRLLAQLYPRAHRALRRERVSDLSLLYTWAGSDAALPPVLLAAHLDVVPVDPATQDEWEEPPFGGAVRDGVVWGRGAIDDKINVIAQLEAVEWLLAQGFRPARTVHLAFGHDEEVGGSEGAAKIAALLGSRGVELAMVLDEGGVISDGFWSELEDPLAVIGIAEKGSVSIALDLAAPGGHSSTPPAHTAIGELARAVVRLEDQPMPAGIDGVTALFLDHLAPEVPFAPRLVLANRWLFDPLLEIAFTRLAPLDAMQRTTTAVTMFDSGIKENALPTAARAVVNFRIHPRDRIADVEQHVRRVVDDDRIALTLGVRSAPREPSGVSPVDGPAWRALAATVRAVLPGVRVIPYLVVGGTDARHYAGLTPNVYRFAPMVLGRDSMRLAHGVNERIAVDNLVRAVRFYVEFLRRTAEARGSLAGASGLPQPLPRRGAVPAA